MSWKFLGFRKYTAPELPAYCENTYRAVLNANTLKPAFNSSVSTYRWLACCVPSKRAWVAASLTIRVGMSLAPDPFAHWFQVVVNAASMSVSSTYVLVWLRQKVLLAGSIPPSEGEVFTNGTRV